MTSSDRQESAHRSFEDAPAHVVEFYQENHREQTLEVASAKAERFKGLGQREMSAWEALLELDALVDESDPDTELGQLDHALQTAEAARMSDAPEWLVVTALVHDLGKVLCTFGEPMWAVVGDTFPLGCAFREEVVFHELFRENPDARDLRYSSETGVYEPGCGLDAVTMSWGHDEYLACVLRGRLPEEALYVVRYHSFYAAHSHGAYRELFNERDHALMPWVQRFQTFDLYSKTPDAPERDALLPTYRELLERWLPEPLSW
ncbi:MAG: inositol oxygenase [Planctomycetes bacterium]|nr:inositol oxygenase [Planctomycetota bacterium]